MGGVPLRDDDGEVAYVVKNTFVELPEASTEGTAMRISATTFCSDQPRQRASCGDDAEGERPLRGDREVDWTSPALSEPRTYIVKNTFVEQVSDEDRALRSWACTFL